MSHLSAEESAFLKAKAKQIRIDILKMITKEKYSLFLAWTVK